MAATVVFPCVTWIETFPKVVDNGKARAGLELGPKARPKMENSEPRAMEPAGNPPGMKLAALITPRPKISADCAKRLEDNAVTARTKSNFLIGPPSRLGGAARSEV